MSEIKNSGFFSFVAAFFFLYLLVDVLHAGSAFLIPIIIGLVLLYIILAIAEAIQKIPRIPFGLALTLSFGVVILAFWIFVSIIESNVTDLANQLPLYQHKIATMSDDFLQVLGASDTSFFDDLSQKFDMTSFLTGIASGIAGVLSMSGTILIYLLFLFFEYFHLEDKIRAFFPNKEKYTRVKKTLETIHKNTKTYIGVQTFVSFITAVLVYIIFLFFGLEFAAFWALLTFILNYIPVLGSIFATLFPILFAFVQFGMAGWTTTLLLLILVGTVQFAIGNVLQPRMMGNALDLSPFFILFFLGFWGMVWGILGAFLAVPIMVILSIVFAQFPSTRFLSILFSQSGKVPGEGK